MSAVKSNYVPTNNVAFCHWGIKILDYAEVNYERWGISKPPTTIKPQMQELLKKALKCEEPTRSKVDTRERNEMRKPLEQEMRNYIQGFITRNINVTAIDREMMALPVRDNMPTPIGNPVGLVTAMFRFPQEGMIEVRVTHINTTEFDKRANYGVKIAYGVFATDQPAPTHARQLPITIFTRRRRYTLLFDSEDSHKLAYFCLCYENTRGIPGQWGPIVNAMIP